jgi:hypothetical protein
MRLEAIGRSRDLSAAAAAFDELTSAMDSLRPSLVALGGE